MMNDCFNEALEKIKLIAGGLYGVHYEPQSKRDVDLADAFVVASTGGLEVAAYCYRGNWKMELKFIPVRCNAVL